LPISIACIDDDRPSIAHIPMLNFEVVDLELEESSEHDSSSSSGSASVSSSLSNSNAKGKKSSAAENPPKPSSMDKVTTRRPRRGTAAPTTQTQTKK